VVLGFGPDPARVVAVWLAIVLGQTSFGLAVSRSVPHPTRLETRTKESNVHASRRVLETQGRNESELFGGA
jgi:hypothetical protein